MSDNDNNGSNGALSVRRRRGAIGRGWLARQWLELFEQGRTRSELEPARRSARRGHVLSLELAPGLVRAAIRGSEDEPCQCSIALDAIDDERWAAILDQLPRRAQLLARLLAGKAPEEVEALFTAADARLLPSDLAELRCSCSCGQSNPPCTHLGAVFYLVAERLDDDPFVLFQLRGRDRERVIAACRQVWGAPADIQPHGPPDEKLAKQDIVSFYQFQVEPPKLPPEALLDNSPGDIVERLGFPSFFPDSDRNIVQSLKNLYDEA